MPGVVDGDFLITGAGCKDACLEESVLLGGFTMVGCVCVGIEIGIHSMSCRFTNCICWSAGGWNCCSAGFGCI